MTLLDERTDTDAPTGGAGVGGRVFTTPTSSWRFASRLARREVRRRPGRTILVMLLVVVPVIGMTVGSVLYRSGRDSAQMSASRQFGTADLVLSSALPVTEFLDPAELVERPSSPDLPAGSRTTDVVTTYTNVSADVDGTVITRAVGFGDVDLNDPITSPTVEISDGRARVEAGRSCSAPTSPIGSALRSATRSDSSDPIWTWSWSGSGARRARTAAASWW